MSRLDVSGWKRGFLLLVSLGGLVAVGALIARDLLESSTMPAEPSPTVPRTSLGTPEAVPGFYRIQKGPYLEEPTRTVLLLVHNDKPEQLVAVDVDAGRMAPVEALSKIPGAALPVLDHHGRVVVVKGKEAYALDSDLNGEPIALGQTYGPPHVFISRSPDRLWLQTGEREVSQVDLHGRATQAVVLPEDRWLVAETDDGLLIRSKGRLDSTLSIEIWDPSTRAVRMSQALGLGEIVDARASVLAWVDNQGTLHLKDLRAEDRHISNIPRHLTFTRQGKFSPDGRYLAIVASLSTRERVGNLLGIVDLMRGSFHIVKNSGDVFSECFTCVSWDPSGQWVFFLREGQEAIGAYHPGAEKAELLELRAHNLALALVATSRTPR